MNDSFLEYYEHELDHLRCASQRFAAEFPKVASRLQLGENECADPYVERLLEGVAFLTARIARKMDDGLSDFSETLLLRMAPEYVSPVASRAIVRIHGGEGGVVLPAGTALDAQTSLPERTLCRFTVRESVRLSGLEPLSSSYEEAGTGALAAKFGVRASGYVRAEFLCRGAVKGDAGLFVSLPESAACELMALLLHECSGIVVQAEGTERFLPASCLSHDLPESGDGGLPALAEYFLLPGQMAFLKVAGLADILPSGGKAALLFLLEGKVSSRLCLLLAGPVLLPDCVRVVNAFPRRLSRILPSWRQSEHLVPEATAASDYEVLRVDGGAAYSEDNGKLFDLFPFYHATHGDCPAGCERLNYISIHRENAVSPPRRRMSPYVGSDVFVQLSGPDYAALRESVASVAVRAVCSNRDIPLFVRRDARLSLSSGEVEGTALFVDGPTPPREPLMRDASLWMGIALARLSPGALAACGEEALPGLLRSLLRWMHAEDHATGARQLEGIHAARVSSRTHTVAVQGDLCTVCGWRVDVTLNENAFGGTGMYLFARALAEFLFGLCEINSFMEVRIRSVSRILWSWQHLPTNP